MKSTGPGVAAEVLVKLGVSRESMFLLLVLVIVVRVVTVVAVKLYRYQLLVTPLL